MRQAVLVIHGMGNQSPMSTLRGFVEAIWTRDLSRKRDEARVWSKRDRFSDDMELRRLVTEADAEGRKTDFFEFYWAHLMEGTSLSAVIRWFVRLFLRPAQRVPPAVLSLWHVGRVGLAVILLLILIVFACLFLAIRLQLQHPFLALGLLLAALVLVVLLAWLRQWIAIAVVGDAARYLTADPQNISARAQIRRLGLKLLEKLHEKDDDEQKYERVIVVGHSLGSVIGYDILSFYWNSVSGEFNCGPWQREVLFEIERAAKALVEAPDKPELLTEYRRAQREFARLLAERSDGRWRITDFVTLGSPLAHAHFLMVNDRMPTFESDEDAGKSTWTAKWYKELKEPTTTIARVFAARAAQREFPLCPPVTETGDRLFYSKRLSATAIASVPHGAALFAAVRWTNIHAPRRRILWGDAVSGPVAPLFGPGVKDVRLTGVVAESRIAHTEYWRLPEQGPVGANEHLFALRDAVNLGDL